MPNNWAYPPSALVSRTAAELGPQPYARVWKALEAASQFPGAELTSWYRDPLRNQRAGGTLLSQHQLGLALDLYAANLNELAAHLRQAVPGGRVVVEARPPHVHFQALPSMTAAARSLIGALRLTRTGR